MNKDLKFERRGRATIIDVARIAGVSDATVSRALNKPATVSEATRKRIDDAIAEIGYVPNPLAKAMVSGRTYTVGALIPTLDHAIFSKFLNALEGELSEHGYGLIVAVTNGDPLREVEKATKLISMGVEGLLLTGLSHNDALEQQAARSKIPLLATSYFEPETDIPTIGYDNEVAATLAAQHLIDLGHTEIAVIHGPVENNDRTLSRLGALEAIKGAVNFTFVETPLDFEGGSAAAATLDDKITALLCLSDVMAIGALSKLYDLGKRIPEDISVMGFDNMDASAFTTPPLTTIRLPISRMGKAAARTICEHLSDGRLIASQELPSQVVERKSTARPR